MRYYVTALNRAAIVTELTLPHVPFVNGEHLLEAPIAGIPETTRQLLSNDHQKRALTERAFDLVTTELTMAKGVATVLSAAVRSQEAGGRASEGAWMDRCRLSSARLHIPTNAGRR
jgi:hypothetical protein